MRFRRSSVLAAAIFLFVLGVDLSCPIVIIQDSRWNIPVAISLERHGDLDIEEYRDIATREKSWSAVQVNGRLHNLFPYGASILAAPFVAVIDVAAKYLTGTDIERLAQTEQPNALENLFGSLAVAGTAVFVFLIARTRLKRDWPAVLVALVFAFGTTAWSVASRAYWMHGPSMLLLSAALYLAVRGKSEGWWGVLMGALLGYAFVVRPTNCLPVAAFGIWLAFARPRGLLPYLVGVGIIGMAYVAVNLTTFGVIVPGYSQPKRLIHAARPLEALPGLLISPARGLLVFSPVVITALMGLVIAFRRRQLGSLDILAVCIVIGHWVMVSLYADWWGGWSFGPRYWTDVLPFIAFLALPAVDWMTTPLTGERWVLASRISACVLAAFSIWVHAQGAFRKGPHHWNAIPRRVDDARLWDWSDIQFLRR
ncbi:MAG: hypothetical protein ACJ8M1_06490 [Chthoniobacterales bacterium]